MAERHSQGFFDALDKETAVIPNISDSELRARIYREAMLDAAREGAKLLEENESLKKAAQFYERAYADTSAQNFLLCEENKLLNTHKKRYQEEILELEKEAETYRLTLHRISKLAQEVGLE